MNIIYIVIGVLVIVAGYVLTTYNFFASARIRIRAAVQEIGNQLKRQMNLIPNLEASVKGYLKHEKEVIQLLADARKAVSKAEKSGNIQDVEQASDLVTQLVPRLQVIVEDNPQLQSAGVVQQLMGDLRDTADKLMFSRRVVIDLTADYNTARVQIPSNIVAGLFGFGEEKGLVTPESGEHVEVSSDELKSPRVNL